MMIATAPTKSAQLFSVNRGGDTPDLAYYRRRYPETVANLGTLPRREEWLRRIWEREARWRAAWETRGGQTPREEVVVRGAPPAGRTAEAEFDVIYAGGAAAVMHAAALACAYGRRVLVLGGADEGAGTVWNISEEELEEFEAAGVFTRAEVETAVLNRYKGGVVKLHDAASRVKAGTLWVSGALDVALDGARLVAVASERLRRAKGCAVAEGLRFVRAYVEASRVVVEAEGAGGARRFFASRLFADASDEDSAVARQFDGGGAAVAHVRASVGTSARGFARGEGRDEADFSTAEILVSTEDASAHRQLFWEGFAGSPARGDYATRLFFYDTADSPADKSLLALFERYFESLPAYKRRGAGWRVERPLFAYEQVARGGWRGGRCAAFERVMVLGGEAGGAPSARGCGAHAGALRRAARLTERALAAGASDADTLSEISNGRGSRVARAVGLSEFMRPAAGGAPHAVNETLNALMAALAGLDERVRREVFQGRMSTGALGRWLARTARLYPRIFARLREHFGARGTLCWVAGVAEAAWREKKEGRKD